MQCAIIGCGRMGRHHSAQLQTDGRGAASVLYDRDPVAAAGLQRECWPAARVATTLDELWQAADVDGVILCTPTAEHFPQATAALARGWHVLCEKPLAQTREQIVALIEQAHTACACGLTFTLGYQRRHAALYRTLRREVRSGRWGKVRAIASHNVEDWESTITRTWRDDPAQNPGGFITDAGSHKLDMLFYTTGLAPREVYARTQRGRSHVEIVASVSALFEGDVTATIDFIGHAQYLGEDLQIHCERADLLLRHGSLWIGERGTLRPLLVDEPESTPVAAWLDTILKGAEERSPPEAALPVYDFTQAILSSGRTGMPVGVPLR